MPLLQFPYVEAVVKETLRLYPPVPTTTREARGDIKVGPYSVPAGATVVTAIWSYHHDPEIWPEAASFRPERFLPVSGRCQAFLNKSLFFYPLFENMSSCSCLQYLCLLV